MVETPPQGVLLPDLEIARRLGILGAWCPASRAISLNSVPDIIRAAHLNTVTATPVLSSIPEIAGGGFACNSVSDGLHGLMPAYLKLNPPLTLVFGGKRTAASSNSALMAGANFALPHIAPFICYTLNDDASSVDYGMESNQAGTLITPASGMPTASWAIGDYHVWVCVFGVSAQTLYRDGVSVGTGTVTHTSINYSSTTPIGFGDYTGSGRNASCIYSHMLVCNKALNAAEAKFLSDELTMWDWIARRRRNYFDPGGGGIAILRRRIEGC
jgi:hypothetical protein